MMYNPLLSQQQSYIPHPCVLLQAINCRLAGYASDWQACSALDRQHSYMDLAVYAWQGQLLHLHDNATMLRW